MKKLKFDQVRSAQFSAEIEIAWYYRHVIRDLTKPTIRSSGWIVQAECRLLRIYMSDGEWLSHLSDINEINFGCVCCFFVLVAFFPSSFIIILFLKIAIFVHFHRAQLYRYYLARARWCRTKIYRDRRMIEVATMEMCFSCEIWLLVVFESVANKTATTKTSSSLSYLNLFH